MIFRLMRRDTVGFHHHKNDMAPVLEHQYISLLLKRIFLQGETVLITEGALKADIVVRFRPNARVIATSGVTCSHSELVKAARPYTALIAFDADHRINPAVCRQFARLIVEREQDSREHESSTITKVVFWNGPKGIDDALRENASLRSLTISEWYATLRNEPLEEVTKFWREIVFEP
jgi:hypothetical protein